MNFEERINAGIKEGMKAKDKARTRTLRAVKAEILLLKTDGSGSAIDEEKAIKVLQKMLKQRQESHDLYKEQNREDLAETEAEEMAIIKGLLPAQLSDEELEAELKKIIDEVGAESMRDMGKVMGKASQAFAGSASGKRISATVKKLLS